EEGATRAVNVNGNVEACFGQKLVERYADLAHRLELQGEGDSQRDHDPDGVFIAALQHFFGRKQQAVAFHGDFPNLHVEVTAELVPADLNRAHHEVGGISGLALGAPA